MCSKLVSPPVANDEDCRWYRHRGVLKLICTECRQSTSTDCHQYSQC